MVLLVVGNKVLVSKVFKHADLGCGDAVQGMCVSNRGSLSVKSADTPQ